MPEEKLVLILSNAKGSIPLYMQIKDLLVARVTEGEWSPGDIIPSEIQLARELSVSQGTVRKAITELVETNVLVRRQGRGTFVAIHDGDRALFHFFHIVNDNGTKTLPECRTLSCRRKRASRQQALKLNLVSGAQIICIERIRILDNQPTILETIILPTELFGNFGKSRTCDLPNTLYEMYETQFGITIHQAEERLRAVAASDHDVSLLGLEIGTPLLEIERIALTLDGTPVELRISRCNTTGHYYQNTVF
ncbi:MAG: GntR family transcriptional regulator [Gammaproteobacteria bacterium]|nr:GntR family transcriptional regulator [Gammaproteobacteria bacterium]